MRSVRHIKLNNLRKSILYSQGGEYIYFIFYIFYTKKNKKKKLNKKEKMKRIREEDEVVEGSSSNINTQKPRTKTRR